MDTVRADVAALMGAFEPVEPVMTDMQAAELKELSEANVVKKVGTLFIADQKKSGIFASVSMAQIIKDGGYATGLTYVENFAPS